MITETKTEKDVLIISLKGALDVSLQNKLKTKLSDFADANAGDMILDFGQVTFIDSSCLGTIVSMAKKLREKKGDIKLINLSDDVRSIFQITRLDRVLEIFDDSNAAVQSFYK